MDGSRHTWVKSNNGRFTPIGGYELDWECQKCGTKAHYLEWDNPDNHEEIPACDKEIVDQVLEGRGPNTYAEAHHAHRVWGKKR